MQENKESNYFLSQPHQPFFILGVGNAIVMMLLFALVYKGVFTLTLDALTLHVYSLIFLVFCNIFTGFLFTTYPKFNQTNLISKSYYTKIFFSNIIGTILFIAALFLSKNLLLLSMSILFISQAFTLFKLQSIYTSSSVTDKNDSLWILLANYFGLVGHLFFILSLFVPPLLQAATQLSFYTYLIFLAFVIAQRMIPFFSHSFVKKDTNFISMVFVGFMLKIMFSHLHAIKIEIIVDFILGAYMLYEFLRWKLQPVSSPPILWVLHLALFWLPLSFILSGLSLLAELFLDTSFYFFNVHLLALGFLTTLLIGFGTRVTLGHSGQAPNADKFATSLFVFIQVLVLSRALFSINVAFGWGLDFLFDISITLWLVLFILWSSKYAKILISEKKL